MNRRTRFRYVRSCSDSEIRTEIVLGLWPFKSRSARFIFKKTIGTGDLQYTIDWPDLSSNLEFDNTKVQI